MIRVKFKDFATKVLKFLNFAGVNLQSKFPFWLNYLGYKIKTLNWNNICIKATKIFFVGWALRLGIIYIWNTDVYKQFMEYPSIFYHSFMTIFAALELNFYPDKIIMGIKPNNNSTILAMNTAGSSSAENSSGNRNKPLRPLLPRPSYTENNSIPPRSANTNIPKVVQLNPWDNIHNWSLSEMHSWRLTCQANLYTQYQRGRGGSMTLEQKDEATKIYTDWRNKLSEIEKEEERRRSMTNLVRTTNQPFINNPYEGGYPYKTWAAAWPVDPFIGVKIWDDTAHKKWHSDRRLAAKAYYDSIANPPEPFIYTGIPMMEKYGLGIWGKDMESKYSKKQTTDACKEYQIMIRDKSRAILSDKNANRYEKMDAWDRFTGADRILNMWNVTPEEERDIAERGLIAERARGIIRPSPVQNVEDSNESSRENRGTKRKRD